MSITYNASTNFGAKDALPVNDPDKVIYGAEFTTEFNAITAAFGSAAPTAAPTFTGTATFADVTIGGQAVNSTLVSGWNTTKSTVDAGATNWDTAYGWGDHSAAGYADGTNEANWDTAYGWGDHSVEGYITGLTGIDDNATTTAITIDASENVGVGTASPSTMLHVDGNVIAKTDTDPTNTGSVTLDFGANQNFVLTLTGNVTLANPSTEVVGQSGFIVFIQDSTGGRTVSLGTDYETSNGAGLALSSAASATDIVPYVVAASGRILLGTPQLAFS